MPLPPRRLQAVRGRVRTVIAASSTVAALGLAQALGAAQFVPQGLVPPSPPETETYVVQRGDSLATIAAELGLDSLDGWRRLFDANPDITDPDLVLPGQELTIPDPDEELAARAVPRTSRRGSQRPSRSATARGAGVWDRLAACESNGNWSANTGNGYYGGLQFSLSSWRAVGGTGYPHEASRAAQIAKAERLKARQGWGAWPHCSRLLGLG